MDPPSSPPAPRRPADAHDRTSSDDTIGPSPTLAPAPLPPTSSTLSNSQASLGRGAPPPAPTSPKGKARTQSASTTSSILFAPAPWTTPIPSPSRKPTRILQGARPFSAASGYFDEGGSVVEEEEEGEEGWERKGKAVRGVRSTSVVPSGSKGRSKSRAREVVEEEEPVREGDDEVARRDRGEELVRKRMKDRARVKKEAEKASRKRESDARRTQLDLARRASYNPTAFSYDLDADLDRSVSGAGVLPPLARRSTEGARSRDVSRSGRDSVMSQSTEGGRFASEAGTQRALPWETGSEAPLSPALGRAGGVDGARDEEIMSEGRSLKEGEVDSGNEEDIESGILEEEEDEDDTEVGGEVEYTLKDRQDAINIEHPFGLPIWKPALYKKSRSVTRNAETALHAAPSATALRHLAPGNILWTLVFGIWLYLICLVVGAILWCVPWGGSKYGRVIYELGGYLVWPFGKYVEGWSDRIPGEEDDNIGEDIEEEDEEDEDEDVVREALRHHDVEDAGKTYGRGRIRQANDRSTLASSRGTLRPGATAVDQFWNDEGAPADLPDEPRRSVDDGNATPTANESPRDASSQFPVAPGADERAGLLRDRTAGYGTAGEDKALRSSSEETVGVCGTSHLHDFGKDEDGEHAFRVRALGRVMYWVGFYLVVAPVMLLVCLLCWGMVFTIPMAKLLWVLLLHLSNEPLSLHFHSPPKFTVTPLPTTTGDVTQAGGIQYPLRAGQRAPRVSRKSVADAKAHGRLFGPRSTVLLCTYRAAGLQYYKYTVDGVNILFINLLSLVFFVIADFFFIAPHVEEHKIGGFLGFIAGQGTMFVLALLSVIPLSYFIGMAVASISAQSSIGMGAVINASFGSIIEIILYCIALTQAKAELVEGSIIGSILAAVLLMPGLSMIGGATRRKEQRFNARSAGVTSTMLIMAIIGILTPTLFYEIYGSFQLTCTGCDTKVPGSTNCSNCYYEHVDPVDDPFYQNSVKVLSYYCAIILVLSYLIGLWFSLRTHASQIWQNAQPTHEGSAPRPVTLVVPDRTSALYKRVTPAQLPSKRPTSPTPLATPRTSSAKTLVPGMEPPQGMSAEDFSRAIEVVASAGGLRTQSTPVLQRQLSHVREQSAATKAEEAGGAGGHDAPNWSRTKSASVLMGCTVLYAIIAEILVDVVDVVLEGSGIPEKLLGVTLFALVPNTTEFMNAISFAINGNIALSMEIGSAYALQVCLVQAPAMLAFSAYYGIGKESMAHRAFTLVFPRWDVMAILFSVFLLTYTYIESRSNYYRGSILCLSYLVLLGGFAFAPGRDGPQGTLWALSAGVPTTLSWAQQVQAVILSLFTR